MCGCLGRGNKNRVNGIRSPAWEVYVNRSGLNRSVKIQPGTSNESKVHLHLHISDVDKVGGNSAGPGLVGVPITKFLQTIKSLNMTPSLTSLRLIAFSNMRFD